MYFIYVAVHFLLLLFSNNIYNSRYTKLFQYGDEENAVERKT